MFSRKYLCSVDVTKTIHVKVFLVWAFRFTFNFNSLQYKLDINLTSVVSFEKHNHELKNIYEEIRKMQPT